MISDRTLVRQVLEAAVLAPSSHNTQPWLFTPRGESVDLIADRTRALPVNDPHDRELTISCGAALFNARAAASHAGEPAAVTLLPEPGDPDVLARFEIGAGSHDGAAALFDAVAARRTSRDAFTQEVPGEELVDALIAAAAAEGAWLSDMADEPRRESVAALVGEGDRMQFADPSWRRELASWMHPRRRGDGLAQSPMAAPFVRAVVTHFDVGASTAGKDERLAATAPLLIALGTAGDSAEDWLTAGQALERVLLTAAAAGWQAGYLNQPCQVPELRPRLAALTGQAGYPQVLMRIGRPQDELRPAPRRPVENVIEAV